MTRIIAYERDGKLDCDAVTDTTDVDAIFDSATAAWLGEVYYDRELVTEPGIGECHVLLVVRRPLELVEYDDPFELLEAASLKPRTLRVVGMRVVRRKSDPWPEHLRALIDETVERDDDDPRLVLADALGGDRSELARVQCELARGGLEPARSGFLRRRQRELLASNGATWSHLRGIADHCVFRRGFVEVVRPMLRDDTRLPSLAPHLAVVDGAHADEAWPTTVRGLAFEGDSADRLTGKLTGLTAAQITLRHSEDARVIAETNDLRELEVLRLYFYELEVEDFAALTSRSPKLRVLEIHAITPEPVLEALLAAIPTSIRQLVATESTPRIGWSRVSSSPVVPFIEKLALPRHGEEHLVLIAAIPCLRSLDLRAARASTALPSLELPALRELALPTMPRDELRAIAARFGLQLELLDVRGNPDADAIGDELRALVAGDVWLGPRTRRHTPMLATYLPGEPMWDLGVVELTERG
ncbi:MAG TPA: hypothetical protein VGG74_27900 [Kofleriaceae bacterium]